MLVRKAMGEITGSPTGDVEYMATIAKIVSVISPRQILTAAWRVLQSD